MKKLTEDLDGFGIPKLANGKEPVSEERKVVKKERGPDGLFIQPKDTSPDRETEENHHRENFVNHFNYADPYAGNTRTFDPKGNYNCGACNQAKDGKCLLVQSSDPAVPLSVDLQAGSCRHWENLFDGDSEMELNEMPLDLASYGVAANGKGFGCHRCPFASKAHVPDSNGRTMYCGKGDFRVFENACCTINGAELKDENYDEKID